MYYSEDSIKRFNGWRCEECDDKQRTARNSGVHRSDGKIVKQCPIALLGGRCGSDKWRAAFALYLRYHRHYADHNALPESGGVNDQPARIMAALDILEAARRKYHIPVVRAIGLGGM